MSRFARFQRSTPISGHQLVVVDVRHWRVTLRVTLLCLSLWFVLTAVPLIVAQPIADWKLFGWPAPFAIVAFCVPLAYLLIIGSYCLLMDRLERHTHSSGE